MSSSPDASSTASQRPSLPALPLELLQHILSFLPSWNAQGEQDMAENTAVWLSVASTNRQMRRLCVPVVFSSFTSKQLRHPFFNEHILSTYHTFLIRFDLESNFWLLEKASDDGAALLYRLERLQLEELNIAIDTTSPVPGMVQNDRIADLQPKLTQLLENVVPLLRGVKRLRLDDSNLFTPADTVAALLRGTANLQLFDLKTRSKPNGRFTPAEASGLAAALVARPHLRELHISSLPDVFAAAVALPTSPTQHLTRLSFQIHYATLTGVNLSFLNLFSHSLQHLAIGSLPRPRLNNPLPPLFDRPFPNLTFLHIGYDLLPILPCGHFTPSLHTLSVNIFPSRRYPTPPPPPPAAQLVPRTLPGVAQLAADLSTYFPTVPSLRRFEARMMGRFTRDDCLTREEEDELRRVCDGFGVEFVVI